MEGSTDWPLGGAEGTLPVAAGASVALEGKKCSEQVASTSVDSFMCLLPALASAQPLAAAFTELLTAEECV